MPNGMANKLLFVALFSFKLFVFFFCPRNVSHSSVLDTLIFNFSFSQLVSMILFTEESGVNTAFDISHIQMLLRNT